MLLGLTQCPPNVISIYHASALNFPFLVLKEVIKIIKDEISAVKNGFKVENSLAKKTSESPYALDLDICSSVDRRLVSGFSEFASKAVQAMGMTLAAGPSVFEPKIERWTVLSSPFVHKTARTQFERRVHRQSMRIEGIWSEQICSKLIWYLRRNSPNEIELNITLTERKHA